MSDKCPITGKFCKYTKINKGTCEKCHLKTIVPSVIKVIGNKIKNIIPNKKKQNDGLTKKLNQFLIEQMPKCSKCEKNIAENMESGPGCPNCYVKFDELYHNMIPVLNDGKNQHIGKTPKNKPMIPYDQIIPILDDYMQEAIVVEDYMQAAAIRDMKDSMIKEITCLKNFLDSKDMDKAVEIQQRISKTIEVFLHDECIKKFPHD